MELIKKSEMILIERKEGVSIYGRMVNGHLRQFQVKAGNSRDNDVYSILSDAQKRMSLIIGQKQ